MIGPPMTAPNQLRGTGHLTTYLSMLSDDMMCLPPVARLWQQAFFESNNDLGWPQPGAS